MSDEDCERLREEAAKRLERRRRKMQSCEDRLAIITGQPTSANNNVDLVSQTDGSPTTPQTPDPVDELVPTTPHTPDAVDELVVSTQTIDAIPPNGRMKYDPSSPIRGAPSRIYESVPDPPLDELERSPFSPDDYEISYPSLDELEMETLPFPQSNRLSSVESFDVNMFSSLLTGNKNEATNNVQNEVQVYRLLWVMLAVLVRIALSSSYAHLIGHNLVVPFLLAVTTLVITGATDLSRLQSTSLVTTVLVLFGFKADRVALLTRCVHAVRLITTCFTLYLFSFLVTHIILHLGEIVLLENKL